MAKRRNKNLRNSKQRTRRSRQGRRPHQAKPSQSQLDDRARKSRPGQRRAQRKRKKTSPFLTILALILLALLAFFLYRQVFLAHFDQVPQARSEVNQNFQEALILSDTRTRPLDPGEKLEDLRQVQEVLDLLSGKEVEEKVPDPDSPIRKSVNCQGSDAQFIDSLRAYLQDQDLPVHLLGAEEFSKLSAGLGYGLYKDNSPFDRVLRSTRTQDRYIRMGAKSYKPPQARVKTYKDLDLAVLSGLDFSAKAIPGDQKPIQEFFTWAGPESRLVIDLRNTGGDSPIYWIRGLIPYLSDGPHTRQAMVYMVDDGDRGRVDLDSYHDYLASRLVGEGVFLDKKLEKVKAGEKDLAPYGVKRKLQVQIQNQGSRLPADSIFLLIDGSTRGQAASFADFCKANGLATVCGQGSGPGAWDLPPYLITLPHSGLVLSAQFSQAMDEGQGRPEPFRVEVEKGLEGEDLLQALLNEFKED